MVRAYDPKTLDQKWEFSMSDITWGGMLRHRRRRRVQRRARGLLPGARRAHRELLWRASVGGQVNAGAMSYAVNGKQYVAIAAGNALFAYALP